MIDNEIFATLNVDETGMVFGGDCACVCYCPKVPSWHLGTQSWYTGASLNVSTCNATCIEQLSTQCGGGSTVSLSGVLVVGIVSMLWFCQN